MGFYFDMAQLLLIDRFYSCPVVFSKLSTCWRSCGFPWRHGHWKHHHMNLREQLELHSSFLLVSSFLLSVVSGCSPIFWLKNSVFTLFLLQMCGLILSHSSSALLKFIQMRTFQTLKVDKRQLKNTLMVSLHLAATLSLLFTRLVLIYNTRGSGKAAVSTPCPRLCWTPCFHVWIELKRYSGDIWVQVLCDSAVLLWSSPGNMTNLLSASTQPHKTYTKIWKLKKQFLPRQIRRSFSPMMMHQ